MATLDPAEERPALTDALSLAAQANYPQAIERLRPSADAGYLPAVVLLAWMFLQAGRVDEGLPYARQAVQAGVALVALWYAGRLAGEADRQQEALDFLRHVQEVFIWDVMGYAQSWMSQGRPDDAAQLVEVLARPGPPGVREEWQRLRADAEEQLSALRGAAAVVETDRDRSVEAIREHEGVISTERERVERLVAETTSLVHGVTADHIAKAYSSMASTTASAALKWTSAAIAVAAGAAGWAAFVAFEAVSVAEATSVTIGKLAVSVPLLVLAGYLASIAGSNRRMGWHWRHVELQIRTAEPFMASLDDEARETLLAALAIRFFPGQGQDPQHATAATERLDLSSLVAVLRDIRGVRGQQPAAPG